MSNGNGEEEILTNMHHFGISFAITPVEEIEHFFLKLFAVFFNILPGLERESDRAFRYRFQLMHLISAG
jgi:hypothetical protein